MAARRAVRFHQSFGIRLLPGQRVPPALQLLGHGMRALRARRDVLRQAAEHDA
jgi:hypothetical protein